MSQMTRRNFLNESAGIGLGTTASLAWAERAAGQSASPNEKIVLGFVGVRGRGNHLAQGFAARSDVEIAYLADVDTRILDSRQKNIEELGRPAPRTVQDFRKVLDDDAVDAIVVATPDHWHALATVWGAQSGKHVYVEKPISHTPWEGRKMVEAARKYERVVQAGLQNRSAPYNRQARDYIASGKLGGVHMVRVCNQKHWGNAKSRPDEPVPEGLDWEMWSGPAPKSPYNDNYFHRWNHFWRYSGGDIINDGVHQMDLARWLIGRDYPKSVYCTGGRWAEEGVYETPDTQVAVFEFDDLLLTFELTLFAPYMLKSDPGIRNNDIFPWWLQNATRIEVYGTRGLMEMGRHGGGWQVFDRTKNRRPQVMDEQYGRFPDPDHKADFLDAIRTGRRPNADIEKGHKSTLLCQFANISYRLGGRKLFIDPQSESFRDDEEANALLKRQYRKPWVVPENV